MWDLWISQRPWNTHRALMKGVHTLKMHTDFSIHLALQVFLHGININWFMQLCILITVKNITNKSDGYCQITAILDMVKVKYPAIYNRNKEFFVDESMMTSKDSCISMISKDSCISNDNPLEQSWNVREYMVPSLFFFHFPPAKKYNKHLFIQFFGKILYAYWINMFVKHILDIVSFSMILVEYVGNYIW